MPPATSGAERRRTVARLPSHTTVQFVLLIAVLIAAALVVSETAYWVGRSAAEREAWADCLRASYDGGCDLARLHRERLWWTVWSLVTPIIVLASAVLLRPVVRRRRRRLQSVPEALRVATIVESEWSRIGIGTTPRLLWNPRRSRGSAEVWWAPNRYELEISPGLVSGLLSDSPLARAVVRHEAAHVRNRDVLLGTLADGAMAAYVLGVVTPFTLLYSVVPSLRSSFVLGAFQLAVFGLIITLARSSVLRSRELDADSNAALVEEFELPPATEKTSENLRDVAMALFAHHPSFSTRTQALTTPDRLLQVTGVDGFVAGFVTFLYYPVIERLVNPALDGVGFVDFVSLVSGALAAPLGLWIGVSAVRVGHASSRGSNAGAPRSIALGVALGFGVGLQVFGGPPVEGLRILTGGVLEVVTLAFVLAAVAGVVVWIMSMARLVVTISGPSPAIVWSVVGGSVLAVVTVIAALAPVRRAGAFGQDLQDVLGNSAAWHSVWTYVNALEFNAWLMTLTMVVAVGVALVGHRSSLVYRSPGPLWAAVVPAVLTGLVIFGFTRVWRWLFVDRAIEDPQFASLYAFVATAGVGILSAVGGLIAGAIGSTDRRPVEILGGAFVAFGVGMTLIAGRFAVGDPGVAFVDVFAEMAPTTAPFTVACAFIAVLVGAGKAGDGSPEARLNGSSEQLRQV